MLVTKMHCTYFIHKCFLSELPNIINGTTNLFSLFPHLFSDHVLTYLWVALAPTSSGVVPLVVGYQWGYEGALYRVQRRGEGEEGEGGGET